MVSNNNFIFIHIPKCGGMSITKGLGLQVSKDMHTTITEIIEEKLKNRFTFSFVRNPFDRVVSWYFFHKSKADYKFPDTFQKWMISSLDDPDYYGGARWKNQKHPKDPLSLLPWISHNGKVSVDYVGKLETLTFDLNQISKQSGIKLSTDIPFRNKSNRDRNYRKYHTALTQRIVKKRYGEDLEYFKYQF
jgi:hypothetical protein